MAVGVPPIALRHVAVTGPAETRLLAAARVCTRDEQTTALAPLDRKRRICRAFGQTRHAQTRTLHARLIIAQRRHPLTSKCPK